MSDHPEAFEMPVALRSIMKMPTGLWALTFERTDRPAVREWTITAVDIEFLEHVLRSGLAPSIDTAAWIRERPNRAPNYAARWSKP